ADSALKSKTTAGPTRRAGSISDTSLPSLPEIQWIGASMWVPTCSPWEKLLWRHIGPASLKRATSSRLKSSRLENGSGRRRVGVDADSVFVRSTICTAWSASPAASCARVDVVGEVLKDTPGVRSQ